MTDEEKKFWVLAVKLLFKRINEGQVKFVEDEVPETIKAIQAVTFDEEGTPIFESISPLVRNLARVIYMNEYKKSTKDDEEREKNSPVQTGKN